MILDACTRLRQPAVLATVVRVEGSAYRRPGARMLIRAEGETLGMVSGGCLETDLVERAQALLQGGAARTVVYDMRSPDDIVWGLGLGCDGEIRVLLEPLDPARAPDWSRFAVRARQRRGYAAVATVYEAPEPAWIGRRCWVDDSGETGATVNDGALTGEMQASAAAALEARTSRNITWEVAAGTCSGLIEVVRPRVGLVLFGAGADADPIVDQAAALNWSVTVLDHRETFADSKRFPQAHAVRCIDYASFDLATLDVDERTALVLLTHHFLHDRTLLERLIDLPAAYLGVIGPRRRLERLLEQLAADGVTPSANALARLHGPVGLDIGSETPEEIALSLLSEIQAKMSARPGRPLRDGTRPLHDWPR